MQRTTGFDNKPPVASLDFNEHLRQAYWNAENALGIFQAISSQGTFISQVPWEKFEGCVDILVSMIIGTPDLAGDITFRKILTPEPKAKKDAINKFSLYGSMQPPEEEEAEPFNRLALFSAITDLFHRRNIFKEAVTTYGGHL